MDFGNKNNNGFFSSGGGGTTAPNGVEIFDTNGGTCSTYRCCVNNEAKGDCSASLSGEFNKSCCSYGVIVGGKSNLTNADCSFIGTGISNCTLCTNSLIVGGCSNKTCSTFGFIGGGCNNLLCGSCCYSTTLNGLTNTVSSSYSFISNGKTNCNYGFQSFIGTGCNNVICCCNSLNIFNTIQNGCANTINEANYSTINNGLCNQICGLNCSCNITISGGSCNSACKIVGAITSAACKTFTGSVANGYWCNLVQCSTTGSGSCAIFQAIFTAGVPVASVNLSLSQGCGYAVNDCVTIAGTRLGGATPADDLIICITGVTNTTINGSSISGGICNCASSCFNTISGGYCNRINGQFDSIGGGRINCIAGVGGRVNTISGGCCNKITSYGSFIGGGSTNILCSAFYDTITGGSNNCIIFNSPLTYPSVSFQVRNNFIGGGAVNSLLSSCGSATVGGFSNVHCCSTNSFIGAALSSCIFCSARSFIGTGNGNKIFCDSYQGIISGQLNCICGAYNLIGTGICNTTYAGNIISVSLSSFTGTIADGEYFNIAASSTSGVGKNAILSFTFVGNTLTNLKLVSGGYGYVNGNTLTFLGTVFGASAPADNVVLTVNSINSSENQNSYIASGEFNTTTGINNLIGSGCCNVVAAQTSSFIATGCCNYISRDAGNSFIGGGTLNRAETSSSNIVSGICNLLTRECSYNNIGLSTIQGGCKNCSNNGITTLSGGNNNSVWGTRGSIVGGSANAVKACYGFAAGAGNSASCTVARIANQTALTNTFTILNCNLVSQFNSCGTNGILVRGYTYNDILGECVYSSCSATLKSVSLVGANTVITTIGNLDFTGSKSFCNVTITNLTNREDLSRANVAFGINNIAAGYGSSIMGGECNDACTCYSSIGSGLQNTISGYNSDCSYIGGGKCNTISTYSKESAILGGVCNKTNSSYTSIIVGGFSNCISSACCSFIGGGYINKICNSITSSIVGGCQNEIITQNGFSSIVGGYNNKICCRSQNSSISGGVSNLINCLSCYSFIGAGCNNCITCCSNAASLIGGEKNCITNCSNCSTISGGYCNTICNKAVYSAILGGFCNIVCSCNSGAFGCCLIAACDATFYTNNHCSCGFLYTSCIGNGCVVCSNSGQLIGFTLPSHLNYGVFSQTASSAPITATTTEGTLIDGGQGSLTVPANGFSVGDSFYINMSGIMSAKNNDTIRLRLKSGTVVLGDSGALTLPTITGQVWNLNTVFTIRQIGASGTASIASSSEFHILKFAGGTQEGFGFNTINSLTFDTTISNTLDITAEWSSNSALNSIYSETFVLNKTF